MNEKSYETIQSVDVVLFITPANEKLGTGDKFIINKIKETTDADLIAVITKVDLVEDKNSLDNKAQELKTLGFNKVLGVGKGFTNTYSDLIEEIKKYSYESEVPYEEDQLSDVSLRFIAKEIIRESAINNLYQEVPHSIAVQIDEFKENDDETFPYTIFATIFVKSESQKGIVIGQGGNKIKSISMSARTKMSKVFDHPVNLFLKVKVDNNWVDKEDRIKKAGY